jgi:hypothetical protein
VPKKTNQFRFNVLILMNGLTFIRTILMKSIKLKTIQTLVAFTAWFAVLNTSGYSQCMDVVVADSSFESGVFDYSGLNGWWPNDGCDFDNNSYHGAQSVCSNSGGAGQYITVDSNTTYYFSCFIYNPNGYDITLGAGGTSLINPSTSNSWTFVSFSFFTGSDTSVFISYYAVAGDPCIDLVRVTCSDLTGIEQLEAYNPLLVYPNPANEIIHVDLGEKREAGSIAIIDASGKEVRSENYGRSGAVEISVTGLAKGVYYLKISNKTYFSIRKVVVE